MTVLLLIGLLIVLLELIGLTGTFTTGVVIGGLSVSTTVTETADSAFVHNASLTAGDVGSLTVRTDEDTGTVTLASGHGITNDDVVDVFWDGGVRYGMDVGSADATTIVVDGGAGDALPTQDTALVIGVRSTINCGFDGDNVQGFVFYAAARAHVVLEESDETLVKALELIAGEPQSWYVSSGIDNPVTGEAVGNIKASAGTAAATNLQIAVLYNS